MHVDALELQLTEPLDCLYFVCRQIQCHAVLHIPTALPQSTVVKQLEEVLLEFWIGCFPLLVVIYIWFLRSLLFKWYRCMKPGHLHPEILWVFQVAVTHYIVLIFVKVRNQLDWSLVSAVIHYAVLFNQVPFGNLRTNRGEASATQARVDNLRIYLADFPWTLDQLRRCRRLPSLSLGLRISRSG